MKTLMDVHEKLCEQIELLTDKQTPHKAKKELAEVAMVVSSLAKQVINNADVVLHTIKLDALEELLEAAGGDPVLVLYAYQHDADRIRQRIACRALDTPEDIEAWNRGEIPVALAHPASIGHGLNLQDGGHIIIWYGLTWSLELYQQANERLNRPGQRSICRIYHLVLHGTHDERVLKALSNKDKGQAAAIDALRLEIVKE